MLIDDTEQFTVNVGGQRIQKMVICYSGRIHYTAQQNYIALHHDLVDTELSADAAIHIQNMKQNAVNPYFKAIGYKDCLAEADAGAWDDWDYVNQQEAWFMHTNSGTRIERNTYPGQYLMNPNSGWSEYNAVGMHDRLTTYPVYDGYFLDDHVGDLESQAYGPYTFMYPDTHTQIPQPYSSYFSNNYSRSNWSTWMTTHSANIRNHFDTISPDTIAMANCHVDTYLGAITKAQLFEGFLHSRSAAYNSDGYYASITLERLNLLFDTAALGTIIATNSGCTGGTTSQKEEWAKYCWACLSFASVDLNKSYFSWEFMGSSPTTNPTWYSFMDVSLGAPLDNNKSTRLHVIATYVYERTFDNYNVIANMNPLTTYVDFTFQGANYRLYGKHALFIPKP